MRECVRDKINSHSTISWPLKVEELQCDERNPSELLRYFYQILLLLSKNKSETYTRFVDSFSSDIMFAISNGKYTTLKHSSLGLGLLSMIGMKNPINILHCLGHSLSCDMVCRIETYNILKTMNMLPLKPDHEDGQVGNPS